MTSLLPNGYVIPMSIVSGGRIRCVDSSTAIGDFINSVEVYIQEYEVFAATINLDTLYRDPSDHFFIDDTVCVTYQPTPYTVDTTYWVVYNDGTHIKLSLTKGGTPITATNSAASMRLYQAADNIPYPVLRPYPVQSNTMKSVVFVAEGYSGNSSSGVWILSVASALSKPSISGTKKDLSIFIYNVVSATVVNRNSSTNNHLFFRELKFTNLLSKIGTATFSVVNPGDATSTELDLLLAGSGVNAQKDNLVAIIQGDSVVWSGKITRSIQNKTGLFDDPLVQTWDIDCESDIVRMKYQEVLPANKAYRTDRVGLILQDLVARNKSTDINWNGDFLWERGIRTSEGIFLEYEINESDMFTQFMILSQTSGFDWRTRLGYFRATYSRSGTTYTPSSGLPYSNDVLIGKWMVVTSTDGGLISFGKITDNSTYTVESSMTNTPAASGTIIVLLDPILDFAGNLSTPTQVQTYRMNAQQWTGGNGYGFNDKTDRTQLATKIVVKGKTERGNTIVASVAAVQPFMESFEMFAFTTYITKKTDGRIISFIEHPPSGMVEIWLDGWGYGIKSTDRSRIILKDGTYLALRTNDIFTSPEEIYFNGSRATYFLGSGYYNSIDLNGAMCIIIDSSDMGGDSGGWFPDPYQRYYVQTPCFLSAPAGKNFYINGEIIDITDAAQDTERGTYIRFLCNNTTEHRIGTDPMLDCHGVGAIVWEESAYDEANPATGSPVYYHGLITQTYMVDINTTLPDLKRMATQKLIEKSSYFMKATFWCMFDNWWKTGGRSQWETVYQDPPEVGDSVLCLQDDNATETELLYGQLKNLWKVIGWSFSTKDMRVEVELGDYEKNVFTVMSDKTSSLLLTAN